MKLLSSREKKEINEMLEEQYGVKDFLNEFLIVKTSKKEKLWLLNKFEIPREVENLNIKSVGLYFGRIDRGKIRLSIEGAQLISKHAKKNIVEIEKDKVGDFIRGFDIEIKKEGEGYVIVKSGEDILGCAYLRNGVLENILPKARKIKNLTQQDTLSEQSYQEE